MKARTVLYGFIASLLFSAILSAQAQTPKPAAAPHPASADLAARKQLAAYLADFKTHPEDAELRDKIIDLAKTLKPAPAVPQLVRTGFLRASTQLKMAATADDFKASAKLFEQVALEAPWYADAYFSAASAYLKAADFDGARRNLTLCLKAARTESDTAKAANLQQELDRQQNSQRFQQALQEFQKNPSDSAREGIIKAALAMTPAPASSADAAEHEGAAEFAFKNAKSQADYLKSAKEYENALLIVPWSAADYFNCGVAYEKGSEFDAAIRNFNFYLLAAPDAQDTNDVRKRIGALKYAKEQAIQQQQAAEAQARAEQERREAPKNLLRSLKAKYDGASYNVSQCSHTSQDGCSAEGGPFPCNCTEAETHGSSWYSTQGSCTISFPDDGTILISCGLYSFPSAPWLRGTPQGGSVEDVKWTDTFQRPGGAVWLRAWNGLDMIQFSTGSAPESRPVSDSQYSSAQRYRYVTLQKR